MGLCVCGYNPPTKPNRDCERCGLICKIQQLESAVESLQDELEETIDHDHQVIVELRCEASRFRSALIEITVDTSMDPYERATAALEAE